VGGGRGDGKRVSKKKKVSTQSLKRIGQRRKVPEGKVWGGTNRKLVESKGGGMEGGAEKTLEFHTPKGSRGGGNLTRRRSQGGAHDLRKQKKKISLVQQNHGSDVGHPGEIIHTNGRKNTNEKQKRSSNRPMNKGFRMQTR